MLDPLWLSRMSQWVRRPPRWRTVKIVAVVVALCLALYAVELAIGWPEALTPERFGRRGPTVTEL